MKKISRKYLIVLLAIVGWDYQAKAQNFASFLLKDYRDDAQKLLQAYMGPGMNAMADGLNGGWNYTAKRATIVAASLNVVPTFVVVGNNDKTFDANSLGFSSIKVKDGQSSIAPTLLGDKTAPEIVDNSTGVSLGSLTSGYGSKLNGVLAPAIQLSVATGQYLGYTAFSLRYIPEIAVLGAYLSQIGIGVKHDIRQYIPVLSSLDILDWAIAANYNRFAFGHKGFYEDANLATVLSAFNVETIVSKELLFVTPSLAIGYGYSGYTMNLAYSGFASPLAIDGYKNNLYATLGLQMDIMHVIRLYGSISVGTAYQTYGGGLGVGVDL